MRRISIVFRREFSGYFATPLAAIFLVVFLFLASMFAFNIGGFFDRGQADLRPFFQFHPWLYLFLVPAISMRLWAEERRTGTIELIATLPLTMQDLVLGKFIAAWAFSVSRSSSRCPCGGPSHFWGSQITASLCARTWPLG